MAERTPHSQYGTGKKATDGPVVVVLFLAQIGCSVLGEFEDTADGS